ncbi:MAG: hypothetical protein ACOX57_05700 [Limnochordia bacterium]
MVAKGNISSLATRGAMDSKYSLILSLPFPSAILSTPPMMRSSAPNSLINSAGCVQLFTS